MFLFILILIVGSFYFLWFLEKKAPFERANSLSNSKVEMEVAEGEGSTEVGKKLEEAGLN